MDNLFNWSEIWTWAQAMGWACLIVFTIAAVSFSYANHRQQKKYWAMRKQEDADIVNAAPYTKHINGWVQVNARALKIVAHSPPLITMPEVTRNKLGYLGERYLHDLVRTAKSADAELKTMRDDSLRGMTIGSALFNYSIPESFVLIDDRTCQMASRFVANDLRRMRVIDWLTQEEEYFTQIYNTLCAYERIHEKVINKDTLLDFYHKHHPIIAQQLMRSSQGEHFPDIQAFIASIMRLIQKSTFDDVAHHHTCASISIMAGILDMSVPKEWVWTSDCATAVSEILLGVTPKGGHLKLIINNQ